jgi:hypothetical protein
LRNDHKSAPRPRRTQPLAAQSLDIDRALMRACHMRPLTDAKGAVYNQPMSLSVELYKALRQNIEAEFEARIRELEVQRREAITALNEAWPKMGGSEEDLASFEIDTTLPPAVEGSRVNMETAPAANGSSSRTVPMKVVRQEVNDVMSDERIHIVTQSEIKERILKKYPNSKVPSVRSAISHFLKDLTEGGALELIEKGQAGAPNKYRKTGRTTEASVLGP